MYFAFDGKGGTQHGTEAEKYSVIYEDDTIRFITWVGETPSEYVLSRHGSRDTWFRVFVMNNDGKTLNRIECPRS